jgi:hypothetical protein
MTVPELVLMGPFLTRAQAAHRAGLSARELRARPDLLRIGGIWLEEVYFEFQFDRNGIRRGLGDVVLALRGDMGDEAIADWLIRPNSLLATETPLRWEASGRDRAQLRTAALEAVAPAGVTSAG